MNAITKLLEEYYTRWRPLGVAFVQSGSVIVGYGRPCTFALSMVSSSGSAGLNEYRLDGWGACVYTSSFLWERFLIAQYSLERDDSNGPPSSFVRLAAAIERELRAPSGSAGSSGFDPVVVPRQPGGPRPRSKTAEEDEPA